MADVLPSNKRLKASHVSGNNGTTKQIRQPNHIFQPFRAIGHITNDVPFVVQSRGQAYFLTTCVGNAFQIYDCAKFNLRFVSSIAPSKITALATKGDFTYAACGTDIIVYERAKQIATLEVGISTIELMIFGDHLISLTEENALKLWNLASGELYSELKMDESFPVTTMLHPSTYLNKILLGDSKGGMQLWNLRNQKLIYSFKPFPSAITCLAQSPVIDVVAIGCLDGSIYLYNIKQDQLIVQLRQNARVRSISFRTDDPQHHIMATASTDGDIALWDLDKRKLVHTMQGAHHGAIPKIQFLNNQPILITAGADNSVKQWIFDSMDGLPRLLKSRSGHASPPSKIRFYGSGGQWMLSASRDRSLRAVCISRDEQSTEMSQGSFSKKSRLQGMRIEEMKLPQIVDFADSTTREKDWDNVLSAHQTGEVGAYSWSWQRKALGEKVFKGTDNSGTRCVAVSACGNFGFIGSASGRVEMYNMQSGLHRKMFGEPAHSLPITGIAPDALNRYLITSSLDGKVKLWDFHAANLLHEFPMSMAISRILLHSENDLLAVVLDDGMIIVIDVETCKTVREFKGHKSRVTDIACSPEGRWLVTAGLDMTIRTWDLPSGHMVDVFRTRSLVTSLAFSPTGDFLATAQVDDIGISLWANRSQFENVALHQVSDEHLEEVEMPTVAGLDDDEYPEAVDDEEEHEDGGVYVSPDQLTDDMITLSRLPKSKWQTLLNLDTIKQRNRPKEAPKQPERAPFFLPVVAGLDPKLDKEAKPNGLVTKSHVASSMHGLSSSTELMRLMEQATGDCEDVFDYLKSLNPSAIDLELRALYMLPYVPDHAPEDAAEEVVEGLQPLKMFLRCITARLRSKRDFELVQAYLNVFLRIHGDVLVGARGLLQNEMQVVLEEEEKVRQRIGDLVGFVLGVTAFVRNAPA